jgi:hypothetical protein
MTSGPDPLLARNWSKSKVLRYHDNQEKVGLVCFLRERYSERFFRPIECLSDASGNQEGYGFAILSLCCLLIETMQCYRLGWPSSHSKELEKLASLSYNSGVPDPEYRLTSPFDQISSKRAFEEFFNEAKNKPFFPDVKGTVFYQSIRCGLLHQAQTKDGWRISKSGRQWDDSPGSEAINRKEFSESLWDCFNSFLEELETAGWNQNPWPRARKKLWRLAQTS